MLFSWRITEIVTRLRNLFCPLLDTFKYLLKICWNINVEEKRKNIFMNEEILQNMSSTLTYLAKYYGKDWDKAEKMEILMDL